MFNESSRYVVTAPTVRNLGVRTRRPQAEGQGANRSPRFQGKFGFYWVVLKIDTSRKGRPDSLHRDPRLYAW